MKTRSTTWFPVLLMVGLGLLSWWLEYAVREGGQQAMDAAQSRDPDFVVEDFTSVDLSKEGRPAFTVSARRMTHFPHNDLTELTQPRMAQLRPDQAPLHVSADQALVRGRGDQVDFVGNVVLTRANEGRAGELRVETTTLRVFPERNLAVTNAPVTITDGNTRMSGVGLQVEGDKRVLQLNSRVTGSYAGRGN